MCTECPCCFLLIFSIDATSLQSSLLTFFLWCLISKSEEAETSFLVTFFKDYYRVSPLYLIINWLMLLYKKFELFIFNIIIESNVNYHQHFFQRHLILRRNIYVMTKITNHKNIESYWTFWYLTVVPDIMDSLICE